MFLVDTNILVDASRRYYGFDFVPSFWEFVDDQFSKGNLVSIREVFDELKSGNDELTRWVTARSQYFVRIKDAQTLDKMTEIAQWVTSQSYKQSAVDEFLNVADYYLVAYAAAHGLILLTNETPAPESKKRVKIPDVCNAFRVRYADTFEMMRVLGARI